MISLEWIWKRGCLLLLGVEHQDQDQNGACRCGGQGGGRPESSPTRKGAAPAKFGSATTPARDQGGSRLHLHLFANSALCPVVLTSPSAIHEGCPSSEYRSQSIRPVDPSSSPPWVAFAVMATLPQAGYMFVHASKDCVHSHAAGWGGCPSSGRHWHEGRTASPVGH